MQLACQFFRKASNMLHLLAQTMPADLDPSTPGSGKIYAIFALISLVLIGASKIITTLATPLVVSLIKSLGLIKKTWKEEMQDQIQTNSQAIKPLIEANKQVENGIEVDPVVEAKVAAIASAPPKDAL